MIGRQGRRSGALPGRNDLGPKDESLSRSSSVGTAPPATGVVAVTCGRLESALDNAPPKTLLTTKSRLGAIGSFQGVPWKITRERGLAYGAQKRKMSKINLGFVEGGTDGMGIRVVAEPTGRWDQTAPEAPVVTTPSDLVRGVT
jgi:hypothetical protein